MRDRRDRRDHGLLTIENGNTDLQPKLRTHTRNLPLKFPLLAMKSHRKYTIFIAFGKWKECQFHS